MCTIVRMNAQTSAKSLFNSVWKQRGFPVDPVLIANELGIEVVETVLPSDISGALIKDQGKDPVIVLSKSDSNNRKRFTCAHEIGHYAYRFANNGDHYEYIDFRGQTASAGSDQEEIYANQFAAELLMPSEEITALVKANYPYFLLAQYFGVSDDAMRIRLKNLNIR